MAQSMNAHLTSMLEDAFSGLLPLVLDTTIREVMVNGEDDVWIEREGVMEKIPVRFPTQAARNAIQIIASLCEREAGPRAGCTLLDASLSGMRVSAVVAPVATRGHALCIRKHAGATRTLRDYLPSGVPPTVLPGPNARESQALFHVHGMGQPILEHWVKSKMNLLVSGGTSTGKTTFLNALIQAVPATDRLVVIEDTRELTVEVPNHVSFEANPFMQVSVRDLVRQSLRFRPDRIVVGEVRGGEAFDLVQAMNTGHDGCLGTLHANSARDALRRLEQMVMQSGIGWPADAIARQIASSIDGVVHLERIQGRRQVAEIIELKGYENGKYQTATWFGVA